MHASRSRGLRDRLPATLQDHTAPCKAIGDAVAWTIGIVVAAVVRYNLHARGLINLWGRLALLVAVSVFVQVVVGFVLGVYRNHRRFASFEEIATVAESAAITTVVLATFMGLVGRRFLPVAVSLGAGAAALVVMLTLRYLWRLTEQHRLRPSDQGARRTLVFGAGEGAEQLLQSFLRNPSSPYLPVALIDDSPGKANFRIKGVRVAGDRSCIAAASVALDADLLVVAVPSASSELVREISDLAAAAGLEVAVVPPTSELIGGRLSAADMRTPTLADLLGRRQVQTDIISAAGYLTDKRVLVTGAGGSIGSELCRQLHRLGPAELIMVDRDESALHAVQLSLDGRGLLDSPDLVLLDIRDRGRLERVFAERRPQVVFHAAALKHLTLLQSHPDEAIKSNVWGTLNVLRAAQAAQVDRFVNISTDKAANACSALGYSKRIGERLTAHIDREVRSGTYVSVRFGNVLGSRGSVLEAFAKQIAAGGPVSVTHRDVSRYFMTIEEAVQLVIQAGALGAGGEALVLDMGEPVRIAEVAKRLIDNAARPIEIKYTGLRAGEKLTEELFGDGEVARRSFHPMISHVAVPTLEPSTALGLDPECTSEVVLEALAAVSREAQPELVDLIRSHNEIDLTDARMTLGD